MPYNFNYGGVINTGELQGVIDPTNPQDAATKKYVDAKTIYITDTDTELSGHTLTDSTDIRFVVGDDSEIDLFIVDGSVTQDKILNGEIVTTKIADTNVTLAKLNADITISTIPVPSTPLDMNTQRIRNLGAPTGDDNATTKLYVDTADDAITAAYEKADSDIIVAYEAADAVITTNYQAEDLAIVAGYQAADTALDNKLTQDINDEETARESRDSELFELIHAGQPETTVYFDLQKLGDSAVQNGIFTFVTNTSTLTKESYNFAGVGTQTIGFVEMFRGDVDTDELDNFEIGDFIRITQVDDTNNSAVYSYLGYTLQATRILIRFNPYALQDSGSLPFDPDRENDIYPVGTEFQIELGHSGTVSILTLDSETSGIVRHAPAGQGDSSRYLGGDGNWYLKNTFNIADFNESAVAEVTVDTDRFALKSYVDAQDHIDTKYTAATDGGLILQDSEFRVDTDIIADTDYVKAYVAEHANVGHSDSGGFGIEIDQTDPTNTIFSVDTDKIATKASVDSDITALIGGAPGTLDTLKELADAVNNDTEAFNTLFNRSRIDNVTLKRTGLDLTAEIAVDTDKIADTDWVKARIAEQDHIDTKYTAGNGLILTDSEFTINETITATRIHVADTIKSGLTKVDFFGSGENIDITYERKLGDTEASTQETLLTAGNDITLDPVTRTLSVTNPFTDDDESKLDGIELLATADQTAAEIRTLVGEATNSNVFTDSEEGKLASAASKAYVDSHAGVITSNTAGDGIQVDTEGDTNIISIDTDSYFPLQSDRINTLFGRRIKEFNSNTGEIIFETFAYDFGNVTDTYTPNAVLWDQPFTQTRVRYNNNDNFQSEFVNQLQNWSAFHSNTPLVQTNLTLPAVQNSYVSTFDTTATALPGTTGLDQDVVGTWAGNGQGGSIGTGYQFQTNNGTTSSGRTTARSWPNVSASTSWQSKNSIRFDSFLTDIAIRNTYNTASSADTDRINPTFFAVNVAGTEVPLTVGDAVITTSQTTIASGSTDIGEIYYDTPVFFLANIGFIRPTTVMNATLAQRTYGYNRTTSAETTGIRYPIWALETTGLGNVFNVTDLGALSQTGYAESTDAINTGINTWRNKTYSATAPAGNGVTLHLVVSSTAATGFQDPDTNGIKFPPNNGDAGTTVTLGHAGHTVNYIVYSFNITAGQTVNFQPY